MLARRAWRTPKAKCPVPDRGLLEQVRRLDEHLDGKTGGQHVHHARVFRGVGPVRRDADQVVGEHRDVVGRQRAVVEMGEERVVLGLGIGAVGLELGDRDRLHDVGEPRQALAIGRRGGGAVVDSGTRRAEACRDDRRVADPDRTAAPCRTASAPSMRRRRAAGSSSLGTLRATSRDITLKSKTSR